MNTLPFVWELNKDNVISHVIGSPNVRSMPNPASYTKDIVHYLDGKDLIFVESSIPRGGTIESIVADIAREKQLKLNCVASERESEAFYIYYSSQINTKELADAYKKGDEEKLKEAYGIPMDKHDKFNKNIVDLSAPFFNALPTLLVANLAHFIVEPSMLTMYQEKGIKIKRIQ